MPVSIEDILDLIAKEKYEEAKEELKKAIAFSPDTNELYMLYAYCENCIEDICENMPCEKENPPVKKELTLEEQTHITIQSRANEGNYKHALNMIRLLHGSMKKQTAYRIGMPNQRAIFMEEAAKCSFLMNDMDNAKEFYKASLEDEIELRGVNSYLSAPYFVKLKKYDEAFNAIQNGIVNALPQDLPHIYYTSYQICKEIGDDKNAKQDLEHALNSLEIDIHIRPLYYNLYYKKAAWLIELDAYAGASCENVFLEKALLENAKAIALWPRLYDFRLQRAKIFAYLGQKENALKELVLLDKDIFFRKDSYFSIEKGKVYEILGDFKTAEECYKQKSFCLERYYDNLYDFYRRLSRQQEAQKVRQEQRKEARFQDRVSRRELTELL